MASPLIWNMYPAFNEILKRRARNPTDAIPDKLQAGNPALGASYSSVNNPFSLAATFATRIPRFLAVSSSSSTG